MDRKEYFFSERIEKLFNDIKKYVPDLCYRLDGNRAYFQKGLFGIKILSVNRFSSNIVQVKTAYKAFFNAMSILMAILSRFLRNQEQYQEIMKDMMAIYERINSK